MAKSPVGRIAPSRISVGTGLWCERACKDSCAPTSAWPRAQYRYVHPGRLCNPLRQRILLTAVVVAAVGVCAPLPDGASHRRHAAPYAGPAHCFSRLLSSTFLRLASVPTPQRAAGWLTFPETPASSPFHVQSVSPIACLTLLRPVEWKHFRPSLIFNFRDAGLIVRTSFRQKASSLHEKLVACRS
jgi:hypothetical protein